MGEASYRVQQRWKPAQEEHSVYPSSERNRHINNVDRVLTRALEVNLNPDAVNLLYDSAGLARTARKHVFFGCKQVIWFTLNANLPNKHKL